MGQKAMRIGIVGAGPTGCHLAHRLGGLGHQILLFDPRAPYEKPCGGGLGPLIGRRLPEVMALPFARHYPSRLVLCASDGGRTEWTFDRPPWAIVSREEFGRALLERALGNGQVRLVRQRVVDLDRSGEVWQVRTGSGELFPVDYLVGADGARSTVRRRLVGPIPRQHLALGLGYWVQGAPDAMVFQTFSDVEGYLWSFPRTDHASVGLGCRLGALPAQEMGRRLSRFLAEVCPGTRPSRRWAALLPFAADATLWDTPCAGPGWALVGDAAGHAQPISGEGIAYALWSAELLAQAFAAGEPLGYETLWRAAYGQELAATSEMLRRGAEIQAGAYEFLFHLGLMSTIEGFGPRKVL